MGPFMVTGPGPTDGASFVCPSMLGTRCTLVGEVDGDATEGVDDPHEADHVDEHVVVDRDAEQLGQPALDRLRRIEPELGMAGDVREEGVGQVVEAAGEAVPQRPGRHGQVLEVAGDRDAGQIAGLAVDADHDHRVGAQAPAVRPGVAAEERDVPSPRGERRRRAGRSSAGWSSVVVVVASTTVATVDRRRGGRCGRGRDAEVGQGARLGDLDVSRTGEHGVEQRVLAHGHEREDGAGEQRGHPDRHHEEGARDAGAAAADTGRATTASAASAAAM